MPLKARAAELRNAKERFKDVLAYTISNSDLYEVEIATARVERRYTHLPDDNILQAQEREERIDKEVKQRETRWSTKKSFRKLGYQLRDHMKPNSRQKSSLNILDVQIEDGLWRHIVGNDQVEEHLVEWNVEHFFHAGATPLVYTDMDRNWARLKILQWLR
jgi:hypothetical protein